ncbi:hypothetical protein T492DRAFT_841502 [Pavlovales sp. CCMP2436]|nr:hypothetical protein T492DRAFT_841502 [Pavlovales sp. CCMP2436]
MFVVLQFDCKYTLVENKRALQEQRVETLTYASHSDVTTLDRVPLSIADPLASSAAAEEQIKMERQRHKYERMSRILINVKAGIQHLTEKLEAVPLPLNERPVALSDDTLVERHNRGARARVLVRTGDRSSADGPRAGGRRVARQLVIWRCKPAILCAPIKDGVIIYIWVARAASASIGRGPLRPDQHEDRSLHWHKISSTPTSRRSRPS